MILEIPSNLHGFSYLLPLGLASNKCLFFCVRKCFLLQILALQQEHINLSGGVQMIAAFQFYFVKVRHILIFLIS